MPKRVDCTELEKAIFELAMSIGAQPDVADLDGVVAGIQRIIPVMSREEIINSIVNATETQRVELDDIAQKLAQIKRDARKESEPRRKERLKKQIEEYQRRIDEGDFIREKPKELPTTKELERLAFERDQLRLEVRRAIYKLKPRSLFHNLVVEPLLASRVIKTIWDLSAPFRQGAMITLGHPIMGIKAGVQMFKAFSAQEAYTINSRILNSANAPLYHKAKLYLAPYSDSDTAVVEEPFMSRLAQKFPGTKLAERTYTTYLNVLRAQCFDAMAASLGNDGEITLDQAKAIARYINEATGRGGLGKLEASAQALNTVFFAPRYVASRFQLMVGHPMWGAPPEVKRLIARQYARFLVGIGCVYLLGWWAGADFEWDPRSADFGKMRFGKSRLDPMAGLSQATVLIGRLVTGETKSTKTGKVTPIRGDKVPYGGMGVADVLANFTRSKLSPTFGLPIDVIAGEDVVGNKVTLGGAVITAPVPITLRDIYVAMKTEGIEEGAALGLVSVFGMGLQTYTERKKK